MEVKNVCKIKGGRQDGAISNGYFFTFNRRGECAVYQLKDLERVENDEAEIFAEFVLDKNDMIMPHSNAVMFGNEYYDEKDEFPLLYTNIYNNYATEDEKLKGVCLVYRVQRNEREFKTTLVQIIEIGFVEDENLWKSDGETEDLRPYGNFTIDTKNGILYAFTMRDSTPSTRYFSFELPDVSQGQMCEKYGVKKVVLTQDDILQCFDCEYQRYIQGACCHEGKIYSLEGYTNSVINPPAIRIIDTKLKKDTFFKRFEEFGITIEPEMIDFDGDICYYGDNKGNMFKLVF